MIYSVTEAITQLKKFCAYQERCQQDVRLKLRNSLLSQDEKEFVISQLISEDFLNEERYARSFTRGKFRIKKWGRRKIVYALRAKGISEPCIRMGLQEISSSEYESTLRSEIARYSKKYNGQSLMRFLASHGFEPEILRKYLNKD
ncbi:MAG: regulatory protein RecX [Bacteroidia bacterium]